MNEQEILQQVRDALAEIKVPGGAEATMETTWQDLDVDSLDLVEVVDEKLDGIASVGDAVRLIAEIKEGATA